MVNQKHLERIRKWRQSPREFIKDIWGLTPERDNSKFIKGKHITWQQDDILIAVEKALRGEASRRISISSGHGIGKSACLSWLILWYLVCFKDAQIPCTAPSSEQMFDILWKESALWLGRMPEGIKELYDWQSGHIRIKERPETWFARAKTARKEAPEALAGMHGEHLLFLIDEASGVPDEIFRTAEGALTGENILVIMISNPTRLIGYFYDSHHGDKSSWQTMMFSSIDSPIVDRAYIDRIERLYGIDSDEYRVRVLGQFPSEDMVDESGYTQLFLQTDLRYTPDGKFVGTPIMGIDPSGEGDDETVWVLRDQFRAKILKREKVSTPKGIAEQTLTLMQIYRVPPQNVYVDNFGVGANAIQQLASAFIILNPDRPQDKINCMVNGVNVGDKPDDTERFINKRAEAYFRIKDWIRHGGEFIGDGWEELLSIRYKPELSGKHKIMGKQEMRKAGYMSPNIADALMLTFVDEIPVGYQRPVNEQPTDRYGLFAEI